MDSLVLIVCVAILALFAWHGYRTGLVQVLLYIVILVLSVALSGFLVKPISAAVKENTSLYENVEKSVKEVVDQYEFQDIENTDLEDIRSIEEFVGELPFPKYILEEAQDLSIMVSGTEAVKDVIAEFIAYKIFNAIIYIALMVVFYVGFSIVASALKIITRLPVIREVNKLTGLVAGLVEGVIIIWVLFIVIQACGSEVWAQEIFVQINENEFLSFIYNNNVIVNVLSKYI